MDTIGQEISETLEAASEIVTLSVLMQSACQRLQNVAHGDRYAETHELCIRLHRARECAEHLQRKLETELAHTELKAANPKHQRPNTYNH